MTVPARVRTGRLLVLVVAWSMIGAIAPTRALADGMGYILRSAVGVDGAAAEALPTEQRALLWYRPLWPWRSGTGARPAWQLYLEPRFDRPAVGTVWVVPFETCPEVYTADPEFLQQLDLLTAPQFVEVCTSTCSCATTGGCFGAAGAASDLSPGSGTAGRSSVTVWDHGQLGPLDYVLVSAADGGGLAAWMEANGYAVTEGLRAFASGEPASTCYFAARVAAPATRTEEMPVVQFLLPGERLPTYPLRLTALGLAEPDARLRLTLWVIAPRTATAQLVVENQEATVPACLQVESLSPDDYAACLEKTWADDPDGALAVTLSRSLFDAALEALHDGCIGRDVVPGWSDSERECLPLAELIPEAPAQWSSSIVGLLNANRDEWLLRFDGSLSAAAMDRDLAFTQGVAPGTAGASCYGPDDCPGSVCVTDDERRFCAPLCVSTCPEGWTCQARDDLPDGIGYACIPDEPIQPLDAFVDPYGLHRNLYLWRTTEGETCRPCDDVCGAGDEPHPGCGSNRDHAPLAGEGALALLLAAALAGARRRSRRSDA